MNTISIATDEGVAILCEDKLPSITAADLKPLRSIELGTAPGFC